MFAEQAVWRAEHVGKMASELCDPGNAFLKELAACKQCIKLNKAEPPNDIPPLYPQLAQFLQYCGTQAPVYTSYVSSSVFYCYSYSFWRHSIAPNCTESSNLSG